MSEYTKTHRIDRVSKKVAKARIDAKSPVKEKSIPCRESLKNHVDKYSEVGVILRGSRYKMELTQKEVADALGVSQHHISEMENGKRTIGKEMAKRLAEFFQTDYRRFL
ncbi:MAG: helix-turn-helix transcriptional regulator [Chlamydiae bacterium]|nr:helix-turn-helix transcriptional regulator [Chlamydiota bacterium]